VFLIASAAVQDVSSRFPPGKVRLAAVCTVFCFIATFEIPRIMDPGSRFFSRLDMRTFIAERDQVLTLLQKQPGKLLVLVRYGSHHLVHYEWVYNDANIDQSRIVWAHAMPGGKDDELLRYYPDRRVWILDDDGKVTLRPMDPGLKDLSSHPFDQNQH
jgi:hypothetical protein